MKISQLAFLVSILGLAHVQAQAEPQSEPPSEEESETWEIFRSPNSNVEVGNARMAAQDPAGAIQAYDRAARQLPEDMAVQLNRGLAQMGTGDNASARDSFLAATDPNAPTSVRAAAYYDLGLAFYRDGDAAANQEDHQSSQQAFREAADSFRRSLRLQPGNRDAAWNLELALRRLQEEQEAQEQQEQQEQEQQEQQDQQDQQNQDQDQQNQDQNQDQQDQQDQQQNQDQQDGDQGEQEQQQDQQGQDQQDQQEQQGDGQDSDEQQNQDGSDQGDEDRQNGEENDPQQQQQDQGENGDNAWNEPEDGSGGGQRLPNHVERVLDALQDDEQNLERVRARQRAQRDRRRVNQDW